MPVQTEANAYQEMIAVWQRSRAAYKGSDAVKALGTKVLPALGSHTHGEKDKKYQEYLLRALWFNATARTVDGFTGAVFQRAPIVESPPKVEGHLQDIDLAGEPLEIFAKKAFREVLTTGRMGILVDMAPEASVETRPYWVAYRAEDIISWRTEMQEGDEILVHVVLRELMQEPDEDDPFVFHERVQYRVLRLTAMESGQRVYQQQVWVQAKKGKEAGLGEFVLDATRGDGGDITPIRSGKPLEFIPFKFLGSTTTSPAPEKPPLLDLVDVNYSHFRSSADLEHGRHFVAMPTPWISGAVSGTKSGPLEIGSGVAWQLDKDGSAGMVEFTGQGLGAIENAIADKKKDMAVLGARLLEEQAPNETATAVGMRHSGEHATLRSAVHVVEAGHTWALKVHSFWAGAADSVDGADAQVKLNKEFFQARATPEEIKTALLTWQSGGISFETFYEQLQRGDWARAGVSAEEETKQIDDESEDRVDLEPPPPPPTNLEPEDPGVDPAEGV